MRESSFKESPAKKIVREEWNTPFLRYLHGKYGVRYRYMGLPGSDLVDIALWKDMIEEVIAFERPADGPDERVWVTKLRTNLRKLGIPGITYFGSFEEVVILRQDYDGQSYRQDKVITLYNLDFCDEIASQVETREYGRKIWRFEALRVILQDQKECYRQGGEPSHFIILLTVRNQIQGSRIKIFLELNPLSETKSYCATCEKINPIAIEKPLIGTHAWALKAFLCNTLKQYFTTPNVSALFFPFVKYKGTPIKLSSGKLLSSPMLHWMILCKFGEDENATPNFYPENFLENIVSLTTGESIMTMQPEPGESLNSKQEISPVEWFRTFESSFFDGS